MPALQEILGYFLNWESLREHQKINYPILWDGHPARPCIISGQDAHRVLSVNKCKIIEPRC